MPTRLPWSVKHDSNSKLGLPLYTLLDNGLQKSFSFCFLTFYPTLRTTKATNLKQILRYPKSKVVERIHYLNLNKNLTNILIYEIRFIGLLPVRSDSTQVIKIISLSEHPILSLSQSDLDMFLRNKHMICNK